MIISLRDSVAFAGFAVERLVRVLNRNVEIKYVSFTLRKLVITYPFIWYELFKAEYDITRTKEIKLKDELAKVKRSCKEI